jgi:hypothetical protein
MYRSKDRVANIPWISRDPWQDHKNRTEFKESQRVQENPGESRRIHENPGNPENPREIQENPKKYNRIFILIKGTLSQIFWQGSG